MSRQLLFQKKVADELGDVSTLLQKIAKSGPEKRFIDILEYVLVKEGKRLRPTLFFMILKAENAKITSTEIRIASAIELIHIASLIHDDMIDESSFRRGIPASHQKFGKKNSIMLGDFLVAQAFNILSDTRSIYMKKTTAALMQLCQGQIRQNLTRGELELSENDYMEIITEKTASLFRLAAELAEILSGSQISWKDFGQELGIAYQIADDITDIMIKDDPEDIKLKEMTLPLIMLRKKTDAKEFEKLLEISRIEELRKSMIKLGIRKEITEIIEAHLESARSAIEKVEDNDDKTGFIQMIEIIRDKVKACDPKTKEDKSRGEKK